MDEKYPKNNLYLINKEEIDENYIFQNRTDALVFFKKICKKRLEEKQLKKE